MPTGKVKWYDAEKGFGFLSQEEGEDVYVRSSALPAGVEGLKAGQRVEFGLGVIAEHVTGHAVLVPRMADAEAPLPRCSTI